MATTISNKNFTEVLPVEISSWVFSFLNIPDLSKSQRICKDWKNLIENKWNLWKPLLLAKFPNISINTNLTVQQFINQHTITSFNELVKSFGKFCTTLKDGEQGLFRCLFPNHPEYKISVQCGRNLPSMDKKITADKEEFCLFNEVDEITTFTPCKLNLYESENAIIPFRFIKSVVCLPDQEILQKRYVTFANILHLNFQNVFNQTLLDKKTLLKDRVAEYRSICCNYITKAAYVALFVAIGSCIYPYLFPK